MKTRILSIFGILIMILAISATAFAQQNHPMSDTIVVTSKNTYVQLQNFGTLSVGQSECHTIFLQNSTGKALVINSADLQHGYDNADFAAKAIPSLPTVLLSGEIVSVADLCFNPVTRNYPDTTVLCEIGLQIESNLGPLYGVCAGFRTIDTLLRKPCATFTLDGDVFGPIIMGGDLSHTVTITSNRHDTMWIGGWLIGADSIAFTYSGITFPYKLSPLESKTFNVTFSPRSNTVLVKYRDVATLGLVSSTLAPIDTDGNTFYPGQCSSVNLTLPGVAIPPTADSISTALNAGSTDVLAMISDNSVTTQTFNFKNNGSTNLKITGVALKNGNSFAITNIAPSNTLPFTLAPGASMAVTVSMTTVSNGVYYDEVIITAENALISMEFPLQGLRKDGVQAAVHTASSSNQHVTLYPNPSRGDVTIAFPGIHNAKIEVLDILGNSITTATASEIWNWKSTEPAGTYVVHVSGVDESGKSFQSYDRFIIAK